MLRPLAVLVVVMVATVPLVHSAESLRGGTVPISVSAAQALRDADKALLAPLPGAAAAAGGSSPADADMSSELSSAKTTFDKLSSQLDRIVSSPGGVSKLSLTNLDEATATGSASSPSPPSSTDSAAPSAADAAVNAAVKAAATSGSPKVTALRANRFSSSRSSGAADASGSASSSGSASGSAPTSPASSPAAAASASNGDPLVVTNSETNGLVQASNLGGPGDAMGVAAFEEGGSQAIGDAPPAVQYTEAMPRFAAPEEQRHDPLAQHGSGGGHHAGPQHNDAADTDDRRGAPHGSGSAEDGDHRRSHDRMERGDSRSSGSDAAAASARLDHGDHATRGGDDRDHRQEHGDKHEAGSGGDDGEDTERAHAKTLDHEGDKHEAGSGGDDGEDTERAHAKTSGGDEHRHKSDKHQAGSGGDDGDEPERAHAKTSDHKGDKHESGSDVDELPDRRATHTSAGGNEDNKGGHSMLAFNHGVKVDGDHAKHAPARHTASASIEKAKQSLKAAAQAAAQVTATQHVADGVTRAGGAVSSGASMALLVSAVAVVATMLA